MEHDPDIDDFDNPTGINQRLVSLMMKDEFMDYLQDTRVDLYNKLMSDDVSQDTVDEATEEYSKWMAMAPVNKPEKVANAGTNKKGGKLERTRQETSDEAKTEDRAEDNGNSLEDLYQQGHAADDYWKPVQAYHRYPSSVRLRDYIMFCLLIGIAVGVGYLCSYTNRKVSINFKCMPSLLNMVETAWSVTDANKDVLLICCCCCCSVVLLQEFDKTGVKHDVNGRVQKGRSWGLSLTSL